MLRLKLGCDIIFFFFVLLSLFGVSFFRTPCAVYIDSLCKRAFSHVFVASLNFVASFSTSQIHFQTSDLSNPLWTKIHRITDLRDLKTDRCITNPMRSFGWRMRNWSFCPAVLNFKQVGNSYTAGTPMPRLCPVVQWSVHWALSRTTRVLVLAGRRALKTCGKKIASSAFRLNLYIKLTGKIVGNRSTNSAINTKLNRFCNFKPIGLWSQAFRVPSIHIVINNCFCFRACLHGGGGPQVGGVTRLSL